MNPLFTVSYGAGIVPNLTPEHVNFATLPIGTHVIRAQVWSISPVPPLSSIGTWGHLELKSFHEKLGTLTNKPNISYIILDSLSSCLELDPRSVSPLQLGLVEFPSVMLLTKFTRIL